MTRTGTTIYDSHSPWSPERLHTAQVQSARRSAMAIGDALTQTFQLVRARLCAQTREPSPFVVTKYVLAEMLARTATLDGPTPPLCDPRTEAVLMRSARDYGLWRSSPEVAVNEDLEELGGEVAVVPVLEAVIRDYMETWLLRDQEVTPYVLQQREEVHGHVDLPEELPEVAVFALMQLVYGAVHAYLHKAQPSVLEHLVGKGDHKRSLSTDGLPFLLFRQTQFDRDLAGGRHEPCWPWEGGQEDHTVNDPRGGKMAAIGPLATEPLGLGLHRFGCGDIALKVIVARLGGGPPLERLTRLRTPDIVAFLGADASLILLYKLLCCHKEPAKANAQCSPNLLLNLVEREKPWSVQHQLSPLRGTTDRRDLRDFFRQMFQEIGILDRAIPLLD
jgi:hypothetical protein